VTKVVANLPSSPDATGMELVSETLRARETVGVRVDAVESSALVCCLMIKALEAGRPWLMTFANPATAVVARRRPEFRHVLRAFDMVAPDGIGMVLAMRLLHNCNVVRLSFDSTSLAPMVFKLAAARRIGIVLVGGAPGVAERARAAIEMGYPHIRILATFDGYGEERALVRKVVALRPAIVVAGMGAVLQEQFLLSLVEDGWAGVGFTCGGYFDQLALKGPNYYPDWVDRYDLRWCYRLLREPKRLWRRYLLDYTAFGVSLCKDMLISPRDRIS
jgi:N-acetylglucosaminyldiphosphoundecaprenol N-acetyl-beta-D-mannosaminyltransferase